MTVRRVAVIGHNSAGISMMLAAAAAAGLAPFMTEEAHYYCRQCSGVLDARGHCSRCMLNKAVQGATRVTATAPTREALARTKAMGRQAGTKGKKRGRR